MLHLDTAEWSAMAQRIALLDRVIGLRTLHVEDLLAVQRAVLERLELQVAATLLLRRTLGPGDSTTCTAREVFALCAPPRSWTVSRAPTPGEIPPYDLVLS